MTLCIGKTRFKASLVEEGFLPFSSEYLGEDKVYIDGSVAEATR